MAEKMIGNEAADELEDVPVANTDMSMARGMRDDDPGVQAALNQAMKLRGMDYARAGIGALGAGSAAAQGTTNPLAAMIQGIAAGMQIPAQIYKEKQDQLKTTIDATPFGEVVPEAKDPNSPYSILAGIPYGLASKAIEGIALEAVKSSLQSKADKAKIDYEALVKGKSPASLKDQLDIVNKFEQAKVVKDYQEIAPAYNDIIGASNDITGHKVMLIKFAQMLNPSVRVNEQTMDAMDASGTFDKLTSDAWRKVKGQGLMGPEEVAAIKRNATAILARADKEYSPYRAAIAEKAAAEGFDSSLFYFPKKQYKNPATGEMVWGRIVNGQLVTEGAE